MVVLIMIVLFLAWLGFLALWPPSWSPGWWRDVTRPLRHRLRPRHYGRFH